MANTSAVYARIDTGLKESAESILAQLGISPSSAIQMLYSQIVLTRGLPLDLHLPRTKPVAIGGMSRAELDAEITKGVESLKSGRTYTTDEVDAEFAQEFGI
ncbi:MAG: type II toxin-antitoxin system RelB/DinJ family antitoxin [Lachnospiraceae bacterium]|nr:type II toxin-antitoxin system RelB/DinJ family antitoxin [Lachnospiraceae bacterium]MDY4616394.1 type II toxin-antitoxin system RelB/DinJ family antitoxin [Lachnospiraceae bacterium]